MDGDGEKRRTDISATVSNPIFSANTFYLPTQDHAENPRLHFAAYIVSDRSEEARGQARLLGECVVELGSLLGQLQDVVGVGIRQNLSFFRKSKSNDEIVVGHFSIQLKIVGDYMTREAVFDGRNLVGPKKAQASVHAQPLEEPHFKWRIRADLRQAVEVPQPAPGLLPSMYVELGWSLYQQSLPEDFNKTLSLLVENNAYPDFNQQLLIHNPPEVKDLSGFLWVTLKDKSQLNESTIGQFSFPIEGLKPFQPLHLEVVQPSDNPFSFFMSLCLEKPINSSIDQIAYVAVNWAHFEPAPPAVKRFAVCLVTEPQSDKVEIPYVRLDLSNQTSALQVLQYHRESKQSIFLSTWMRPQPDKVDNLFGALFYFPVPRSFLDRNLTMYLFVKDEQEASATSMPNQQIGFTSTTKDGRFKLADLLTKILFEIGHPASLMPIQLMSNSAVKAVGGKSAQISIEVSCHPQDQFMDPSQPQQESKKTIEQMVQDGPESLDDREKWHLLTRELVQKQEIVHRLMRENDDKSQSLKLATAEIVDLRRAMKMLQSEVNLSKQDSEAAELSSLVLKEVAGMSNEDLKQKIVKLASAYRNERLRNEELQKAMKAQNTDLSQAQKVLQSYEQLQVSYRDVNDKYQQLSKESLKTGMYKETVKKQEQVIAKLETLLEKLMRERKIRDAQDNDIQWQQNLQGHNNEEQLRLKIKQQQQIIDDLSRRGIPELKQQIQQRDSQYQKQFY